jgi:dTDP-glucose 4,6-dehydratase
MKIVVTGGAGFIGSHFINKFHKKYEITLIDNLTYAGNLSNIDPMFFDGTNFFKADIAVEDDYEFVIRDNRPDVIINFAAESHVDNSIMSPKNFTSTNILGTQNLLELTRRYGVKKFIQISTDEVYGHLDLNGMSFTEESPLNPRSPYSATKASADLLVLSYVNTYGINASITRCSNNFGENQHEEKLIPKIVKNALNDIKIPVYGTGKNIRDWIYVDDHIDGIEKVMLNGKIGNIYNFGGIHDESEISNLDLVKMILQMMGKKTSLIEFVNDRPGHDFRYSIDYTKSTKELGWTPKHNLNKLKDVIESLSTRFKEELQ